MAITRKRKSRSETTVETPPCKHIQFSHPSTPHTPPASPPQTSHHAQRRIRIHLRTPSAPKRIRFKLSPYARLDNPFEFPSKPADTPGVVFRMYISHLSTNQISYPGSLKIPLDINALIELYFLAERYGNGTLKREVLERVNGGEWVGLIAKESVVRVFERLERRDGLRGWLLGELVGFWTGGVGIAMGKEGEDGEGKEEDWSWVTEEMREDVLDALRRGEGGFGEAELERVKVE